MREKLLKISSLFAVIVLLVGSLLVFPIENQIDVHTVNSEKSTSSIVAKSEVVLSISSNISIKTVVKVFESAKKISTTDGLKAILHSLNINRKSFNGVFYSNYYKIGFYRAALRAILYPFHSFF